MGKHLYVVAFIVLSVFSSPFAKNPGTPVKITPVLRNFDSIPDPGVAKLLFVDNVQGPPGATDDSMIIGYTRTGIKKKAPIVCYPAPSTVFKESMIGAIKSKRIAAESAEQSEYLVRISLLELSIKETSKFLSQEMNAHLKVQFVFIKTSDTTSSRKFTIESENTNGGFDTTKKAEKVVRGAIENIIIEAVKTLKDL